MLSANIICPFKKKTSFIKLEIKSECFYYFEARKNKRDFISNLFKRFKPVIKNKKFTTCSSVKYQKRYIPWSLIIAAVKCFHLQYVSRSLRLVHKKKWIVTWAFFLLNFLSKFIMYRMDTVPFLVLLVSETLKIRKVQVEAYFLKKLTFATNKCLA